ncbi:acid protease [Xylariaceae sp. FL0255]|nr:acid protease [Xylariaceae sp. FL0255]
MRFPLALLGIWAIRCIAASTSDSSFPPWQWGTKGGNATTPSKGQTSHGTRHVKASIHSHTFNKTYLSPPSPENATENSPEWQLQGLASFGVGTVYMVSLEIGTPRQEITVILDTGSSALLVDPDCNEAADTSACQGYGFYNTSRSTSAKSIGGSYAAQFGTGYMEGNWYNDTTYIGQNNLPVPNTHVGVSTWSDYVWAGVLGVSYGDGWNTVYPTLLDLLVKQGYIEVPIFSLGVGAQGGVQGTGNIIFGGVDRGRFSGYLEPIAIWPTPSDQLTMNGQVGYWINLTSFGLAPPTLAPVTFTPDNFTRSMLIDSGSTFTYLDADLVADVAQAFNAWIDDTNVYYVDCATRNQDGYVTFGFSDGNMVIQVSYSDFVVEFDTYCALGVQPASVGVQTWVLGNSFIRGAYIIFDQQNDAVWLAQYESCDVNAVSDLTTNAGVELWVELTGEC